MCEERVSNNKARLCNNYLCNDNKLESTKTKMLHRYVYKAPALQPYLLHNWFNTSMFCVATAGDITSARQIPTVSPAKDEKYNHDSMMDVTRNHFYKQGERQCMLDVFD